MSTSKFLPHSVLQRKPTNIKLEKKSPEDDVQPTTQQQQDAIASPVPSTSGTPQGLASNQVPIASTSHVRTASAQGIKRAFPDRGGYIEIGREVKKVRLDDVASQGHRIKIEQQQYQIQQQPQQHQFQQVWVQQSQQNSLSPDNQIQYQRGQNVNHLFSPEQQMNSNRNPQQYVVPQQQQLVQQQQQHNSNRFSQTSEKDNRKMRLQYYKQHVKSLMAKHRRDHLHYRHGVQQRAQTQLTFQEKQELLQNFRMKETQHKYKLHHLNELHFKLKNFEETRQQMFHFQLYDASQQPIKVEDQFSLPEQIDIQDQGVEIKVAESCAKVILSENKSPLQIELVLSGQEQQQSEEKDSQIISDEELRYVLEHGQVKEQVEFVPEEQQQEQQERETDHQELQCISVEPEDISGEQGQTEKEEKQVDFSLSNLASPKLDFPDLLGDPIMAVNADQNTTQPIASSSQEQIGIQFQEEEVVSLKAETSQDALWEELFELI